MFREFSEEGGIGPDRLSKFQLFGVPDGAPLWGGNLGFESSDTAKQLGGTHGFLAAGGGYDGSKYGGRYLGKGRGIEDARGNRDKTSLGIYREEAGDGSRVSGPATNIRYFCKRYGVEGRWEGARAVVASESHQTTSEGHAKRISAPAWEWWQRESGRRGEG